MFKSLQSRRAFFAGKKDAQGQMDMQIPGYSQHMVPQIQNPLKIKKPKMPKIQSMMGLPKLPKVPKV